MSRRKTNKRKKGMTLTFSSQSRKSCWYEKAW